MKTIQLWFLTFVGLFWPTMGFLMAADREPPQAKAGERGYLYGELIYPLDDKPTPQCHASTIVETQRGLVAAWFGGTREKHDDIGIWVAQYHDGKWSQPVEVVDGSEQEHRDYPCWNPVLFQPQEGPLMLFYKVGPKASSWWGMLITSDDGGRTWSAPRKLGTSRQLGEHDALAGPVKNKPIQFADGSILAPSSTEHDEWRVHFEKSTDGGKTWEVIGPINDGSKFAAIQPSILQHGNGKLQVLCRTKQQVIGQSFSTDGGVTWSEITATELPNPNAGTDAVTLADGLHLLVYNPTTRGRGKLAVAISDDGDQWRPVLMLEEGKGEFSYPAVIQTSDGKVHVTYTYQRRSIKHVVLNPEQLSGLKASINPR